MDIEKRLDAAGIEFPREKNVEDTTLSEQDDLLFKQIDAFRQKAEDIQSLIKEKEDRVSNLEEQLHAKEVQNQEMQNKLATLEEELAEKQKEADGIVANVETQVDRALGELQEQFKSMEGMKEDLFEKVHDENVRVYRNIQDLLKERDEQDKTFEQTQELLKKLGGKMGFLIFIGLLNLGVVVAILLALLDII